MLAVATVVAVAIVCDVIAVRHGGGVLAVVMITLPVPAGAVCLIVRNLVTEIRGTAGGTLTLTAVVAILGIAAVMGALVAVHYKPGPFIWFDVAVAAVLPIILTVAIRRRR
jgi:hypothetical protein